VNNVPAATATDAAAAICTAQSECRVVPSAAAKPEYATIKCTVDATTAIAAAAAESELPICLFDMFDASQMVVLPNGQSMMARVVTGQPQQQQQWLQQQPQSVPAQPMNSQQQYVYRPMQRMATTFQQQPIIVQQQPVRCMRSLCIRE
jgi:hypothetical protein